MEHEYEAQKVPGILRGFGCDRPDASFICIHASGILGYFEGTRLAFTRRIPGLKSETWGTLREFSMHGW
jgi:hypothetical protein